MDTVSLGRFNCYQDNHTIAKFPDKQTCALISMKIIVDY